MEKLQKKYWKKIDADMIKRQSLDENVEMIRALIETIESKIRFINEQESSLAAYAEGRTIDAALCQGFLNKYVLSPWYKRIIYAFRPTLPKL